MRVEFAGGILEPRLRGRDALADMDHLANRAQPSAVGSDRAHEIRLRLERGIAAAGRHAGLHRAAHRGIEQRHGEPAVHYADRVVVLLARRAFEHGVAGLDFHQAIVQERADRRVGQLAVADEEAGGSGAASIIKDHFELIRGAEFLLNEGDVAYVKNGKLQQYGVDVMEKAALWLRIVASGPTGHGSIPIENSSVNRLLNALERLRAWETPISVPPAVAEGYRMRATQQTDPVLRAAYANLEEALKNPALRKRLLADNALNAEVRNTFTITGLRGSEKVNVIPGSAWAQIDARLLPGETPEGFIAKLRGVLNDPELKIEVLESSTPTGSSADTALMHAIRKVAAKRDPNVLVIPTMLTSSTDSSKFRAVGITAYGFEPFKLDDGELERSHGDDERVSVENVRFALQFLYDVILELN